MIEVMIGFREVGLVWTLLLMTGLPAEAGNVRVMGPPSSLLGYPWADGAPLKLQFAGTAQLPDCPTQV